MTNLDKIAIIGLIEPDKRVTIERNGQTFAVWLSRDDWGEDPRKEYDHAGHMVCWHRRYELGDEQPGGDPVEYYETVIRPEVQKGGVALPLYLYDHSGITMATSPFSCSWDSGQVGYIYMEADTVQLQFSGNEEAALKALKSEVEEYDMHLVGDVWQYTIDVVSRCQCCNQEVGEDFDALSGLYGLEYAKEQIADAILNE